MAALYFSVEHQILGTVLLVNSALSSTFVVLETIRLMWPVLWLEFLFGVLYVFSVLSAFRKVVKPTSQCATDKGKDDGDTKYWSWKNKLILNQSRITTHPFKNCFAPFIFAIIIWMIFRRWYVKENRDVWINLTNSLIFALLTQICSQ